MELEVMVKNISRSLTRLEGVYRALKRIPHSTSSHTGHLVNTYLPDLERYILSKVLSYVKCF